MIRRYDIRAHVPANGAPGEPEREFIQYAPTKAMALERFARNMPHHVVLSCKREKGEHAVAVTDKRTVTG